jgi:hypothetical protein
MKGKMMFSDPADLGILLDLYNDETPQRTPWTWSALTSTEREALLRLCDSFVASYNAIHALKEDDIIPPCWLMHPGLASEIPVQVWLYYAAHFGEKATPAMAGDYHNRHLPGFRSRIPTMLGRNPRECRKGNHDTGWRKPIDDHINTYTHQRSDENKLAALKTLNDYQFGIPTVQE